MGEKIVIGTRGSKLALWQANFIADYLKRNMKMQVEMKKIKTKGDKILDSPLSKVGGKGLFVKEIEVALIEGEVDLAVHSMKDLPTEIPQELVLAAVTKRDDPRDALISKDNVSLKDLPQGSKIGTSSLRRQAQLKNYRSDLGMVDVRGNLDTRLRKMAEGEFCAIVLSSAGLDRMGWQQRITERLAPQVCLSAVGQGTIGVEAREGDDKIRSAIKGINHFETQVAVMAERALLRRLEGGCQVPIGALGEMEDGELRLDSLVASLDGKRLVRDRALGDPSQAESLGITLAEKLLARGADEILKEIREVSNE